MTIRRKSSLYSLHTSPESSRAQSRERSLQPIIYSLGESEGIGSTWRPWPCGTLPKRLTLFHSPPEYWCDRHGWGVARGWEDSNQDSEFIKWPHHQEACPQVASDNLPVDLTQMATSTLKAPPASLTSPMVGSRGQWEWAFTDSLGAHAESQPSSAGLEENTKI